MYRFVLLVLCCCIAAGTLQGTEAVFNVGNIADLTPEKMQEFISSGPVAPGRPFKDRAWWGEIPNAGTGYYKDLEKRVANHKINFSDGAWLREKGNGKFNLSETCLLIDRLLVAEGLEHKGRFKETVFKFIREICGAKSWVDYFHDRTKYIFTGKGVFCDLHATNCGYTLMLASWLYGDEMPAELHKLIRDNVSRRVIDPYRAYVKNGKPGFGMWWICDKYNWNPANHAKIAGITMLLSESPTERAWILATAIRQIMLYINAYPEDGYCGEGMDYWSYGFGNYVSFAELIRLETGGKIDLLNGTEKIENIKRSAENLRLSPKVMPAYSDGSPQILQPSFAVNLYLYGGCDEYYPKVEYFKKGLLPVWSCQHLLFVKDPTRDAKPPKSNVKLPLAYYFSNAGVITSRAGTNDSSFFCLGVKFGHNGEGHNHNDVGSFVIGINETSPVEDPGCPVYNWETFGKNRYKDDVINSYGHSVPVVNGMLQSAGRKYCGKVLSYNNTPELMQITGEIATAYPPESGLKTLKRSFSHNRARREIVLSDSFEFDKPGTFSSALMTYQKIAPANAPDTYWFGTGKDRTKFHFVTTDGKLEFSTGNLKCKVRPQSQKNKSQPVRFSYGITGKTAKGRISVTVTPDPEK